MTAPAQYDNLIGSTAVDPDGDKLGKIGQVYLDEMTGRPAWVTVSTGMFGTRQSFAPLYNAEVTDGQVVLAVPKNLVKDAPNIEDDGHLEESETTALYQHYASYLDGGTTLDGRRSTVTVTPARTPGLPRAPRATTPQDPTPTTR